MKIHINELNIQLKVDQPVHKFITAWFPALKSLLIPIRDRKSQLEYNAAYFVENLADYIKYFRFYSAGSMLLGGAILVAEIAYRVQAPDKDAVANMDVNDLIKTAEFKNYLDSKQFVETFEEAVKYKKIHNLDKVAEEMRHMANEIGELTFNKQLVSNINTILSASELVIKSSLLVQINEAKNSRRFLTVHIKEIEQKAYIAFNASEDEYLLLDKWLNMPDLVLEKSDDLNDIGQIASVQDFIQWFNILRLVIESELAHETILDELTLLEFSEYKRSKQNIADRITQISSVNTISKYEIRKKVVEYLHQMLNSRKNKPQKHFVEMTIEELKEYFSADPGVYLLSLYQ